jgi:hypothetical protein
MLASVLTGPGGSAAGAAGEEQMSEGELRRGDLVEVQGPAAILATLDERGALEELPFMPEMAAFCGRRFVVDRRAERVCDTVHYTGSRRPPRTVLLAGLRCDGSGHGGCQAECRLFWKEAWLRRVAPEAPPAPPFAAAEMEALLARASGHVRHTVEVEGRSQERWWCQATELPNASRHLRLWDPRSYVREYTTGNVPLGRFLRVTARASVQEPMRKLGLIPEVCLPGTSVGPGSDPPLDLQPGELVQVKTKEEIAATLTPEGRHRGMWFDREMVPYCGRTFRVRQRVHRFIDERSGGRMIELRKSDCVTLEGVVCSGERSLRRWFCPREIYSYWRECWLRRVEEAPPPASPRAGS